MAVTKLDNAEKEEVIRLYTQGASTAQLAQQFGVSVSTISRLIRESQPEGAGRRRRRNTQQLDLNTVLKVYNPEAEATDPEDEDEEMPLALTDPIDSKPETTEKVLEAEAPQEKSSPIDDLPSLVAPQETPEVAPTAPFLENLFPADELPDLTDELSDLEETDKEEDTEVLEAIVGDEFEDETDLLEEEEDLPEEEGESRDFASLLTPSTTLTILPFSAIGLPDMCYLVVDKFAEIITRPLQDFQELGKVFAGQEQSRTMPIFNNHRLARRFCTSSQRIIKMPGSVLHVARHKLPQKGITHVLHNGKVYSL